MRVRLKGINRVKKTRADGTVVEYFYAWKGGPSIRNPETLEGKADYMKAVAKRAQPDPGKLFSLTRRFQMTTEFIALAPRTQDDYRKIIARIEDDFGNMPIRALSDRRARGQFKSWRDGLARRSLRQADYAWTVLARIMSVAVDRGWIEKNPCRNGGRLYDGSRAEIIWTSEQELAFLATASPEIGLAYMLGVWTGLRQGDLLRLPWSAHDGDWITVKTNKTGSPVKVPVGAPLRVALDGAPRRSPIILTNSRGAPWTAHGFSSSWRKTAKRARIPSPGGPTFADLRGTACTRLKSAGATDDEIISITGHSKNQVDSILRAHYLATDQGLAAEAIRKLETRTEFPNWAPNWPGKSGSTEGKSS